MGLLGAGSLNSTLDDMMKYLAFQMGGGSGPLMQAAVLTQTPIRPTGPKGQIGLAWNTNKLSDGTLFINKDGTSAGGFTSYVAFSPSTETGVVVLSNRLGCKVPLISHNLLSALNHAPPDAAANTELQKRRRCRRGYSVRGWDAPGSIRSSIRPKPPPLSS